MWILMVSFGRGRSLFSSGHDERIPHPVSEKVRSVYVKADNYTPLFIMEDGSQWGCGDPTDGELGLIEKINSKFGGFIRQPRKIMNQVTQVSGEETPFALKSDGTLWTWGSSGIQRGIPATKTGLVPIKSWMAWLK